LLPVCACSKGGTLDKDELGHVFEAINNPLSKQELEDVMNDIDESGDGDVRLARAPRAAPAGWTN
jgi:Ca2+-binding EF-hand superfamily protein